MGDVVPFNNGVIDATKAKLERVTVSKCEFKELKEGDSFIVSSGEYDYQNDLGDLLRPVLTVVESVHPLKDSEHIGTIDIEVTGNLVLSYDKEV